MWEALRGRGLELIPLGHPSRSRRLFWLHRRLMRMGPLYLELPQLKQRARRFSRFIERQLRTTPCDIIFAPIAAMELWSLRTSVPIVYIFRRHLSFDSRKLRAGSHTGVAGPRT
jgi:hypothetical protein